MADVVLSALVTMWWLILFLTPAVTGFSWSVKARRACNISGVFYLTNCCAEEDFYLCLAGGCITKPGCVVCSEGRCWDNVGPGLQVRPGSPDGSFVLGLGQLFLPAAWCAWFASVLGLGELYSVLLGLYGLGLQAAFYRPDVECNALCAAQAPPSRWHYLLEPLEGVVTGLESFWSFCTHLWNTFMYSPFGFTLLFCVLIMENKIGSVLFLIAAAGLVTGHPCNCSGKLGYPPTEGKHECMCDWGPWYRRPSPGVTAYWGRNGEKNNWTTFPLVCPENVWNVWRVECHWGSYSWEVHGYQERFRPWSHPYAPPDPFSAACYFGQQSIDIGSCLLDRRQSVCGDCYGECFWRTGDRRHTYERCGLGRNLLPGVRARTLHVQSREKPWVHPPVHWASELLSYVGSDSYQCVNISHYPHCFNCPKTHRFSPRKDAWLRMPGGPGNFCRKHTIQPQKLRPSNFLLSQGALAMANFWPKITVCEHTLQDWGLTRAYHTCRGWAFHTEEDWDALIAKSGVWQWTVPVHNPGVWNLLEYFLCIVFLCKLSGARVVPALMLAIWLQLHQALAFPIGVVRDVVSNEAVLGYVIFVFLCLAAARMWARVSILALMATPTAAFPINCTCNWSWWHGVHSFFTNETWPVPWSTIGYGIESFFTNDTWPVPWGSAWHNVEGWFGGWNTSWPVPFDTWGQVLDKTFFHENHTVFGFKVQAAMNPMVAAAPMVAWTVRAQEWSVIVLGLINIIAYMRALGPGRLVALVAHKLAHGAAGLLIFLLVGYSRRRHSVVGWEICVDFAGEGPSVAWGWWFVAAIVSWAVVMLSTLSMVGRRAKLRLYARYARFYQRCRWFVEDSPLGCGEGSNLAGALWLIAAVLWPDEAGFVSLCFVVLAGLLDLMDLACELVLVTVPDVQALARTVDALAGMFEFEMAGRVLERASRRGLYLYNHMGQVSRGMAAYLQAVGGYLEPALITPRDLELVRDAARVYACGQVVRGKPVVARSGDIVMIGTLRDLSELPPGFELCAPLVIKPAGRGILSVALTSMMGRDREEHYGNVVVLGTATTRSCGTCVDGILYTTYHSSQGRSLASSQGPLNPRWTSTSDDMAAYPLPLGARCLDRCTCATRSVWVMRQDGALVHGERREHVVSLDITGAVRDFVGASGSPILCDAGHAVGMLTSVMHKGARVHTAKFNVPWDVVPTDVCMGRATDPAPNVGGPGTYEERALFMGTGAGKSTRIPAQYQQQGYKVLVLNPSVITVRAMHDYMKEKYGVSVSCFAGAGATAMTRRYNTNLTYATYGRFLAQPANFLRGVDVVICDECHSCEPTVLLGVGRVLIMAKDAGVRLVLFATATPPGCSVSPHPNITEEPLGNDGEIPFYGHSLSLKRYRHGRHVIFCHSIAETKRVTAELCKAGIAAIYFYRGSKTVVPPTGDIVVVATDAISTGYSGDFDTCTDCGVAIVEEVTVTLNPTIDICLHSRPCTADVRMQRRGRCGRGRTGTYYHCVPTAPPRGTATSGAVWSAVETAIVWCRMDADAAEQALRAYARCAFTLHINSSITDAVNFFRVLAPLRNDAEVAWAMNRGTSWPLIVGVQRKLCKDAGATMPFDHPDWQGLRGDAGAPIIARWGGEVPDGHVIPPLADDLARALGDGEADTSAGPILLVGAAVAAACAIANVVGTLVVVAPWEVRGGGDPIVPSRGAGIRTAAPPVVEARAKHRGPPPDEYTFEREQLEGAQELVSTNWELARGLWDLLQSGFTGATTAVTEWVAASCGHVPAGMFPKLAPLTLGDQLRKGWCVIAGNLTSLVTLGTAAWSAGHNPVLATAAAALLGLQHGLPLESRLAAALAAGALGTGLGTPGVGLAMAGAYYVGGSMTSHGMVAALLSVVSGYEAVVSGASVAFDMCQGKCDWKGLLYAVPTLGNPGAGLAGVAIGVLLHVLLVRGDGEKWLNRLLTMLPKSQALPDGFFMQKDIVNTASELLHRLSITRALTKLCDMGEDKVTYTGAMDPVLNFVDSVVTLMNWMYNWVKDRIPTVCMPLKDCQVGYRGAWSGTGSVMAVCPCGATIVVSFVDGLPQHRMVSSRLCRHYWTGGIPINTMGRSEGVVPKPGCGRYRHVYGMTEWIETFEDTKGVQLVGSTCVALDRGRVLRCAKKPPRYVDGVSVSFFNPAGAPMDLPMSAGATVMISGECTLLPGIVSQRQVAVPPPDEGIQEAHSVPCPFICHPASEESSSDEELVENSDHEADESEESDPPSLEGLSEQPVFEGVSLFAEAKQELGALYAKLVGYLRPVIEEARAEVPIPHDIGKVNVHVSTKGCVHNVNKCVVADIDTTIEEIVDRVGANRHKHHYLIGDRQFRGQTVIGVTGNADVELQVLCPGYKSGKRIWRLYVQCCDRDTVYTRALEDGLTVCELEAILGLRADPDHHWLYHGDPVDCFLGDLREEPLELHLSCETKCGKSYVWFGVPLGLRDSKPPPISRPVGSYLRADATKAYITDMNQVGERIDRVTRDQHPAMEDEYLRDAYNLALAKARKAFPNRQWTYEEAIRAVRPKAARSKALAVADLQSNKGKQKVLDTVDSILCGIEIPFTLTAKQEVFYQDKKTRKPPRLICYPPLEFRVAEKMIMGNPNLVAKAVLGSAYGFQYTPFQRVGRLRAMWDSKVRPVAITVDAKCFDSSITAEDVKRETEIYAVASTDPVAVRALGCYYAEGPMVNSAGVQVGYRRCRASGVLTTSSSNCITSYIKVSAACRKIGLKSPSYLIHGDDVIIICERPDEDPTVALRAALLDYGYDSDPQYCASLDQAVSCSAFLGECNVNGKKKYFLSTDMTRALARACSEYGDPVGSACGYTVMYPCHPIVRYVLLPSLLIHFLNRGCTPDEKVVCEVSGRELAFPLKKLPNILVALHGDCLQVTSDSALTLQQTHKALQGMKMRGLGFYRKRTNNLRVRMIRLGGDWARLARALLWNPAEKPVRVEPCDISGFTQLAPYEGHRWDLGSDTKRRNWWRWAMSLGLLVLAFLI
ncbi:polyprotein [Dolphin pegivirus]|nr:polyprotein [Dolphin pegivirus]